LPNLGKELDKVCQDVYEGRGFSIVRGLEPEDYELEDLTVIYLGISSYVAERRGKQDQRGSMLSGSFHSRGGVRCIRAMNEANGMTIQFTSSSEVIRQTTSTARTRLVVFLITVLIIYLAKCES
jgi:hypothetical protein